MAIVVNPSPNVICPMCGQMYGSRKSHFYVNHGRLYKGTGHLTICRTCVDHLYSEYLALCNDQRAAVRQVCRKLDLYWNEKVFDSVEKVSTTNTVMAKYVQKINITTFAGKSYDDTLMAEGTLWDFSPSEERKASEKDSYVSDSKIEVEEREEIEIPEETINFWGPGYDAQMYADLDKRWAYWLAKFPKDFEMDIGTEAVVKQICSLELDINRDRAAGRPVDKSVNALNTLLGSANLKPVQKKTDEPETAIDRTPLGVWAKKIEDERPIKDIDPELQDVDGIKRYISIWFLGHLCKMLKIKNSYCKLYEDELERLRVERPEFEEDDDETFFNDIFNTEGNGD